MGTALDNRASSEYRCSGRDPLPPGMVLIAGVIDTTTNYVEHPEVVADRLERAANAIGDPSRIMAGTDCGFDSAAGVGRVAEEVAWRKMGAMVDGARVATKRLFR
jgi:5-methyltetrahydropteroyltriglutamate--homocysteine methyltransferase